MLAAARGGGPADVAELVAWLVFAQALKFAAHAALANQPLLQFDLPRARKINVVALGFFQIGKYADCLSNVGAGPALGKMRAALIAKVSRSQLYVAALQRTRRIACAAVSRRGALITSVGGSGDSASGTSSSTRHSMYMPLRLRTSRLPVNVVAERGGAAPLRSTTRWSGCGRRLKINCPGQERRVLPGQP